MVFDQVRKRKKQGTGESIKRKSECGRGRGKILRQSEGVRVLDSVEILEFIPCSNQSPLTWQACDKLSQRLYI